MSHIRPFYSITPPIDQGIRSAQCYAAGESEMQPVLGKRVTQQIQARDADSAAAAQHGMPGVKHAVGDL